MGRRVCTNSTVCAHTSDLSFLFVSAMQVQKKRKSVLTSFVSWKRLSIFSDQGIDRVLILYPKVILEWDNILVMMVFV